MRGSGRSFYKADMRNLVFIALAALLFLSAGAQAQTGRPGWSMYAAEHDRAREDMRSGQIISLESVLANVRRQYPGQLLNAHLSQGGGTPVYEIKMLSRDGRVTSIVCDARTGAILQAREGGRR
jgi:uncharacterized membrane protein YkoI